MKNKFISLVLLAAMLAGLMQISVSAKISEDFSEQSAFLMKIGALSADGDLNQSSKIKRDRFAKDFTAFINGLDNVDTSEQPQKSYYYDVPLDNEYLAYINYLTESGYVIGDDGDKFRPNDYITNMEMLKCVVAAVGYTASASVSAQYPNGYLSVAGNLKLTNKLGGLNDEATIGSMVQLFCNALEVNVMERSISEAGKYEINKDLTYIEKVFDIGWVEGQLDGNYMTTLDAKASSMVEDVVTIDGVEYTLTEENLYLADYLGYRMRFYYRESGPEREIIAFINDDTEETVVSAENITEFSNNRVYYTDGISDKNKKLTLSSDAVVIYNGVTVKSYPEDIFTTIPSGSVEFLKIDNESEYSVVKIYSYETYVVKSASEESNKIFTKEKRFLIPDTVNEYTYTNETFDLDDYNHVFIRNSSGMSIKLSELKENNILSVGKSLDGTVLYINVETKAVQGTIDSEYNNADGKRCLEIAGSEYVLDYSFENNISFNVALRMSVTVYLNYKGEAAYLTVATADSEWAYGYLMNMVYDDVNDKYFAKIFTVAGKAETYEMKEKVSLDGKNQKSEDVLKYFKTVPGTDTEATVEPQLIRYQLSGLILSKIDSATVNISNNESIETTLSKDRDYGGARFHWATKQFCPESSYNYKNYNTAIRADNDTIIFLVPDPATVGYDVARSDSTRYSVKIGSGYFKDQETYKFEAYDVDYDNGALAKVMVSRDGESELYEGNIVIQSVEQTIDDDDLLCYKIVGYNLGAKTTTTYTLSNDCTDFEDYYNSSSSGAAPSRTSITGISIFDSSKGLRRGDVIRVKTIGGKVAKVRRYYSPIYLEGYTDPNNGKSLVMDHGVLETYGTFVGTAGAATDTVMLGVITGYSNGYITFYNIDPRISMGVKAGTDVRPGVPKKGSMVMGIGSNAIYKYKKTSNKLELIDEGSLSEYIYSVNSKAYAYVHTNQMQLKTIVIYE